MPEPQFSAAAVIGTGMMGPGIALTLALGGLRATILSRTGEGARTGLNKACAQLHALKENGLVDAAAAEEAAGRLAAAAELDATVPEVDLVIESGPENMEFKQGLFARMDALARPETVLASNTSSLSITAVASRCARPERVLTTHFWNPPHLMPLVEIVRGEKTSPEIAQSVHGLLARCGKTPVIVRKDRPGQLGNRLQHALWREAVNIVAEGIASAEDVDLAAKTGFGLRLPVYGIFEHADAVGLDMCLYIMDYIARDLYNQPKAPDLMFDLVARGDLGAKTGKGFYDWSVKDVEAVKARRDRFVIEFLRSQKNRSTGA
ncbi:MAG: 3-hydroxyacyl-CoA dehydrogenase family protein [Bryobacterales bacterium]|nr:3-hydroxyacyl-CoA dehydrogenase family protein [Bryobacterales bacterium]